MKAFTFLELLISLVIVSMLSLATYFVGINTLDKTKDEVIDIINKEQIIEVYENDNLIYQGYAKEFDLIGYKVVDIDGEKIIVEKE